jgi:phosphoglycerate kinase
MYINHLSLENKKVLLRVDFNVPLDKDFNILDDTRIQAALPTIQYIIEQGGSILLMSHLGRPQKKKKADGSIDKQKFTLLHTVNHLSSLLNNVPVLFVDDTVGEKVEKMASALSKGEILVLENTRFYTEEKNGDEGFAQQLANLADIYINDAFGTAHRAHASTCTVAQFFDVAHKGFGFLIQQELEAAHNLTHEPKRPFTAIVGGAKVSDKILLLEKMLDNVDNILIGGGMAYTLIKAQGGEIGDSLLEADRIETAQAFLAKAKEKKVQILLPKDSVVADKFDNNATTKTIASNTIEKGWSGLDIGPVAAKEFSAVIENSKTLVWNGPMGVFEMSSFAKGTLQVANAVAEATQNGAYSLVGGGDSVSAINQAGKADEVSFVSTGGGAMLKLLEGSKLPGIEAIKMEDFTA